ncbi:MAG: thioesterase [Eubacteriales bacterium]|jgi:medium-chain acyl-[acyl-carrier-protein] hydrolase|nr:thioesterase [Eubacteriales bacterium]
MKWTENFYISPHDTDINGIARSSSVLRYLQETANLQLYNLGPSNEELRQRGMAFILSRVGLRIYAPLYPYDKIRVQSWACESRLSSFYRCGRIFRGDELTADLMTVWALIGIDDKRVYRATEVQPDFETDEMLDSDIFMRVRIPKDIELPYINDRKICYSDVDWNNHMNNTNYPDMLCDSIGNMTGRRVSSISINFKDEAPLGEVIKIHMANDGDIYYFRSIRENGAVGIESALELGFL